MLKKSRIEAYLTVVADLKATKKLEATLRVEILNEIWPNANEGTFNEELVGYDIKGTFRNNYKLDVEEYLTLEHLFTEGEKACIVHTPKLSLTAYRKLGTDEGFTLADCLTITPGMPSLKIEPF